MNPDVPSWRMTDQERRKAFSTVAAVASAFAGPLGPVAVWAAEYIYDRRDLLFDRLGEPLQAFQSNRFALNLSVLSQRIPLPHAATLSIDTTLTTAAKKLGLRKGDPVSLVLTGDRYVQSRSGLVVPTRIGERVSITAPRGNYSLTAFGSRRDALFTTRDPYQTAAGDSVRLSGHDNVALRLNSRALLLSEQRPTASVVKPRQFDGLRTGRLSASHGTCVWCSRANVNNMLEHVLTCSKLPRTAARAYTYTCLQCRQTFTTQAERDNHTYSAHPTMWQRFVRAAGQL
jgi:hypothetical protein